ncbi:MAG: hypothetical protein WDW38_009934 [Sanguina aurantia]
MWHHPASVQLAPTLDNRLVDALPQRAKFPQLKGNAHMHAVPLSHPALLFYPAPAGRPHSCCAVLCCRACSQLPGFLVGAVLHTDIASQASFLNGVTPPPGVTGHTGEHSPGAQAPWGPGCSGRAETRLAHTQSRRSLFADSRPSWDVPSPLPWS